jgi:hypothetical protein
MTPPSSTGIAGRVDRAAFEADSYATRFLGAIDAREAVADRLFALLNDPANERRLADAAAEGRPAVSGITRLLASDPVIGGALQNRGDHRLRQLIGVAVRLKMERLGWATTGRKATVGSEHIGKAEVYARSHDDSRARALAALDRASEIGDESERAETVSSLFDALAASRAADGRLF